MLWKTPSTWTTWLEETVCWNNKEYIPRSVALRRFLNRGLIPFIRAHGYVLEASDETFSNRIATGLWLNRGKSCVDSNWSFGHQLQRRWHKEDRYRYDEIMNDDEWEAFWATWGAWCDVDESDWRGLDRRIDIQEYIWTQLNLDYSSQTKIVNRILGLDEDGGEDSRFTSHEDTYLREQAESGEVGGYRKPKP